MVVAGDFNLVNGATPLVMLTGPYSPNYKGLIPAELYHLDDLTSWTWDGRGTRYPSGTLDFQLYSPQALMIRESFILDSEDLSSAGLERFGIKKETRWKQANEFSACVRHMGLITFDLNYASILT